MPTTKKRPPGKKTVAAAPRLEVFVSEYLVSLNATQAAMKAGYSPKTAASQGCRLLKQPNMRKLINQHLSQLHAEEAELLARLAKQARGELETKITVRGGAHTKEYDMLGAITWIGKRLKLWGENSSPPVQAVVIPGLHQMIMQVYGSTVNTGDAGSVVDADVDELEEEKGKMPEAMDKALTLCYGPDSQFVREKKSS